MRQNLRLLAIAIVLLASCRPDSPTDSSPASDPLQLSVTTAGAFSSISSGVDNSCVLDGGGRAFCMGWGGGGAVGYGGVGGNIIVPYPVAGGLTFSQLNVGGWHVCALTSAGAPYCWGDNNYGQLGISTSTCGSLGPCSLVPIAVSGGISMRTIDAGNKFSCGLDLNGRALCWGENTFGSLGDGTTVSHTVPQPVAGGLTFVQLRTGGYHACALTAAGQLYCWGLNNSRQLGTTAPNTCNYFQSYPCALAPIPVGGALRFSTFDLGSMTSCAIDTSNKAWCWGNNSWGQVGIPQTGDQPVPAAVNTSRTFVSIATGYRETCAVDGANQGFCWGASNGPNVTLVQGFLWTVLSPNGDHRCGVTTTGSALCWGREDHGEMGEGGTHQDTRITPTALAPVHLVDQPPGAKVFITGCTDLACTFSGMLSTDDYGIVSWNWTLGDGTTGSGPIVNHTYSASGSYPVTLTVTDGAGQNSSASITATVTTNQPPVARFKYSCSISTLKCTFDASASTDDHGVVGYLWHSSLAGKPDKTGVKIVRIFSRGQVWWETITLTDAQGLTSKLTRKVVTP